jgi:prepilin-type N-terminal cleavage/methylation domain-containing protein
MSASVRRVDRGTSPHPLLQTNVALSNGQLLRRRQAQLGVTLIEIMISLTIGLILIAAAGYIFSASKRAYRQNDGVSRVQENTRGALLLMNSVIRNAGYLPDPLFQTDPGQYFVRKTGVDTRAVFGGYGLPTPSFVPASNPAPSTNSDWVAISYMGCAVNSVATATDCPSANSAAVVGTGATVNRVSTPEVVTLHSCLGDPVPNGKLGGGPAGNYNTQIVVNVFYIAQMPSDTVPSLYCATAFYDAATLASLGTPTFQPLLQGVNRMEVFYGIDHQLARQTDQRVVSSTLDAATGGISWPMVSMVQINLTTQNADLVAPGTTASTQVNITSQGYLQARQSQSVSIRNRLN